jgi:hypothetical protein
MMMRDAMRKRGVRGEADECKKEKKARDTKT